MNAKTNISAGDVADQAAQAYLDLLTDPNASAPTYAPQHGSGEPGANPWPHESREGDLYDYAWGWAHWAEGAGRAVALEKASDMGDACPCIGIFASIFKEAKNQTLRQFGRIAA